MKKKVFSATLVAFLTANVQAAFTFTPQENNKVGLYLGSQIWQSEASGVFGEKNTLIYFNLKKEQQNNLFVAIVHPYSLLPNARISSTTIDTTGKITSTQAFNFGDGTFTIGDNVNASFNVSYVDYTLYYGLFNNRLFSFDLGLTARDFNGAATVKGPTITEDTQPDRNGWHESCYDENGELKGDCSPGSTSSSVTATGKIKTDEIEPMLYVATNISLPLTNLSIFAQGDFSLVDDHSLSDYQVGLNYDLIDSKVVDFNVTLGYKVVKIALEDLNNLYTDLEFKGFFVGVITHF
jgi:outer membrane protein